MPLLPCDSRLRCHACLNEQAVVTVRPQPEPIGRESQTLPPAELAHHIGIDCREPVDRFDTVRESAHPPSNWVTYIEPRTIATGQKILRRLVRIAPQQ
ncbi:hypothetical protein DO73_4495 [Burkholderia pseudomallei]|nr:hypothetical protein DO73_4495 [Burkholderia pseudomallei]